MDIMLSRGNSLLILVSVLEYMDTENDRPYYLGLIYVYNTLYLK